MGAVSRGQKGAGRTPRSLRPEIRAGFIGHINNPRSASSPAEPSTTKEPALPGAGTKPRRSNYSLVVCACVVYPLRGSKPARLRDCPFKRQVGPFTSAMAHLAMSPCPPCDTPPEHGWCPASHAPDNSRVSTLTVEPDGRPTTECDVETNRPARRDASACRYSGVATSPRERFFVWDDPPRSGLCGTSGPLPPVITVSPAPALLDFSVSTAGDTARDLPQHLRKAPPKRGFNCPHACRRHSP